MERTIVIDARDYEAWLLKLAQEKIPEAMERGAVSGAARCIPLLHTATDTAPPANPSGKGSGGAFSSGKYKSMWRSRPIRGGAQVFNDASYAAVIEEGRRPGAKGPPFTPDVIAGWAQRRLGLSAKEAKNAAFAIRRAIKVRGLRARKVLTTSIPKMTDVVLEEIVRELERAW